MQPPTSNICVLCTTGEASTREHIPAELFFDRPLPSNLITVPSCAACNHGSQQEDEYLRAFMMLLRGHTPSPAIENVRARTVRQLDRSLLLCSGFQAASEVRWEAGPDGRPVVGLFTRPDRERLWKALTKYACGLHFWSTGSCRHHHRNFIFVATHQRVADRIGPAGTGLASPPPNDPFFAADGGTS